MGIRNDIQISLAAAMDGALADTVEPFTATSTVSSGTYDPVTGAYPSTTTEYTGRWIRDEWSVAEIDALQILATDVKRIVLQSETTWEPKPDDVANGLTVISARQDGALATWELQLRRT